ncbi:MAG: hypothetical protein ACRD35_08565 [Candidatus Acidiferrales bacterium]
MQRIPIRVSLLMAVLILWLAASGQESAPTADARAALIQMIKANSYELRLREGRLEGPGGDRLVAAGENAQFVVFAEEHYVREIPQIVTALFRRLQPYGFQYLATESATVHARLVSRAPQRGNRDAILAFVRRFPFSITFFSDEEVEMMADIGSLSRGRGNPMWGVDQEFGVLHVLERVLPSAPSPEARRYTEELIRRAREFELDRDKLSDDTHFIAAVLKPAEPERLQEDYAAVKDEEVRWMIDALVASNRIYSHFREGRYYQNNSEREQYMKKVFLDEYRSALSRDGHVPRVIVKAGHWHALRGMNPGGVFSLGNFLSEFALTNGLESYVVSTCVHGPEGHWRGIRDSEALKIFAETSDPHRFTLVDLRALRPQLRGLRGVIPAETRELFFKADALLVLGNAQPQSTAELGKQN